MEPIDLLCSYDTMSVLGHENWQIAIFLADPYFMYHLLLAADVGYDKQYWG